MADKAEPYLKVDLGPNGGSFEFRTSEEVIEFLEREIGFWGFLNEINSLPISATYKGVAADVLSRLRRVSQVANSASRGETKHSAVSQQFYNAFYDPTNPAEGGGKVPLSLNPKAQYLREAFQRDGPVASLAALGVEIKSGDVLQLLGHPVGFQGVVAYMNFLNGQSAFVPEAVRSASEINAREYRSQFERDAAAFDTLKQDSQNLIERTERLRNVAREWVKHRWKRKRAEMEKELDVHVAAFKQTEETYKTFMQLKAPAQYWETKAKGHDGRTLLFALAATAWAGAAGWLLWSQLGDIYDRAVALAAQTDPSGAIIPLNSSLVFILIGQGLVISTIVFWIARVLVRLFLSELHLAMDARERTTMVQCYLALSNENAVEKDSLNIVLQALFRPTQDGIVKDDASSDLTPAGFASRMLQPGAR